MQQTYRVFSRDNIHGTTMGGGSEIARVCRHVIAIDKANLRVALPEILLHCFPPFAVASFLKFAYKAENAMIRFMLTGRTLKGNIVRDLETMLVIGLINRIFSKTPERVIEEIDFTNYSVPIGSLFQRSVEINEASVKLALKKVDTSKLNPEVLEITVQAIVACAQETSLKGALMVAENAYLQSIAPLFAHQKALKSFIDSQQ